MSTIILNVPYLTQPDSRTCQSTCLKMYAMYLEKKMGICSVAAQESIFDIHKEVPQNSHQSFVDWLENYFPPNQFARYEFRSAKVATAKVISAIDAKFPVLVSTTHSHTKGHIILVIGYSIDYPAGSTATPTVSFVCHDPFGKFNPELKSTLWGKSRYATGECLVSGGENGPGKGVLYSSQGIERVNGGNWVFITSKV